MSKSHWAAMNGLRWLMEHPDKKVAVVYGSHERARHEFQKLADFICMHGCELHFIRSALRIELVKEAGGGTLHFVSLNSDHDLPRWRGYRMNTMDSSDYEHPRLANTDLLWEFHIHTRATSINGVYNEYWDGVQYTPWRNNLEKPVSTKTYHYADLPFKFAPPSSEELWERQQKARALVRGEAAHRMTEVMIRGNEVLRQLPFKAKIEGEGLLYTVGQNIGGRILPSIYTRLAEAIGPGNWLRGNRVICRISSMNEGHLENSLKLLNESHGNLVAKATELLGRMGKHFGEGQPLIDACKHMMATDVSGIYPVFDELEAELLKRREGVPEHDLDYLANDRLEW